MTIQVIPIGSAVEAGDGIPFREAWDLANQNFADLDTRLLSTTSAAAAETARAAAAEAALQGAVNTEVNRATAAEALKAPIASPNFTGIPRVPTAPPGTTGTQAASLDFVASAVTAGGGGGGGGGTSYAVTYTQQTLTGAQQTQARQNISAAASGANTDITSLAAPALGAATATTASPGTNTTQVATTGFVTTGLASYASTVSATYLTQSSAAATYAPLASPNFTGSPTAPTQAAGDSSAKLATTAYTDQAAASAAATATPNVATFNGLMIRPGATAASQISVSASSAVLRGAAAGLSVQNVAVTISTGTSGANGLDTGTLAASTWYAIHIIAKADGTKAGLLSLSATAPTLPSGYVYSARAGWARTNASGTLVPIIQNGRQARYQSVAGQSASPFPVVASAGVGDVTAPTYVAVAITSFAPSTAAAGLFSNYFSGSGNNASLLAPNSNYGNYQQGYNSNPPTAPLNASLSNYAQITIQFESANVYAAAQVNAGIICLGWEDNL